MLDKLNVENTVEIVPVYLFCFGSRMVSLISKNPVVLVDLFPERLFWQEWPGLDDAIGADCQAGAIVWGLRHYNK